MGQWESDGTVEASHGMEEWRKESADGWPWMAVRGRLGTDYRLGTTSRLGPQLAVGGQWRPTLWADRGPTRSSWDTLRPTRGSSPPRRVAFGCSSGPQPPRGAAGGTTQRPSVKDTPAACPHRSHYRPTLQPTVPCSGGSPFTPAADRSNPSAPPSRDSGCLAHPLHCPYKLSMSGAVESDLQYVQGGGAPEDPTRMGIQPLEAHCPAPPGPNRVCTRTRDPCLQIPGSAMQEVRRLAEGGVLGSDFQAKMCLLALSF